jgi:single-stranded DNA-binding protein
VNSFKLTAIGDLARNPELITKGDITFARFCLVGWDELSESEYGGPRETVTSLWFLAFSEIATAIANSAGKGDQLILEARIVAHQWTDSQGDKQLGHTFIVTGLRFGAKRGGPGSPVACRRAPPDTPPADAAEGAMEVGT